MKRPGYLLNGRRTYMHRSIVRHLRRVLRAGNEAEAVRYAHELAGYLGKPGERFAHDVLETFRTAVTRARAC